jgi:hypothetical protein
MYFSAKSKSFCIFNYKYKMKPLKIMLNFISIKKHQKFHIFFITSSVIIRTFITFETPLACE